MKLQPILACLALIPGWGGAVLGSPPTSQPQPPLVVEPEEFAARLQRAGGSAPGVVLLDVRPAEKFVAGHLKNARSLDLADWARKAKSKEGGLGQTEAWRRRVSEVGISSDSSVLVCDEASMTEAARAWFILRHFGVERVSILNGGYAALRPLLSPEWVSTEEGPAPAAAGLSGTIERPWLAVGLVEKSALKQRVGRPGTVVLDVRTANEYFGNDARGNPRPGHIPGAVNLPHERLLDERGRLKPPEALRAIFTEAGIKSGEHMVMHCQSGGRSSFAALAALRAGFSNVENYYLSFADWSADESCPVAPPEAGD